MSYEPKVTSSVENTVSNFKRSRPELAEVAGWRIDMAHREWSGSEDFGDEATLVNWLPDDDVEQRFKYMEIQQQDLRRTVAELERYNRDLQKTIREQAEKIKELS